MTRVFVDESIHDRAGFILTALVYSGDRLQTDVEAALVEAGFRPGIDEFKSSLRMAGNPAAQSLRAHLRHVLMSSCKLGIVVCSTAERSRLGELSLALMARIAERDGEVPDKVSFDQGVSFAGAVIPTGWDIERGCDSRLVAGIQVADCAAFVTSTLILAELGLNTKTVEPGDYPSDRPIELAWSLWTALRYSLAGPEPAEEPDEVGYSATMKPFGILISANCPDDVRAAAEKRLGEVYVGCTR